MGFIALWGGCFWGWGSGDAQVVRGWEGEVEMWELVAGNPSGNARQQSRTAIQHKAFIRFLQLSRLEAAVTSESFGSAGFEARV